MTPPARWAGILAWWALVIMLVWVLRAMCNGGGC